MQHSVPGIIFCPGIHSGYLSPKISKKSKTGSGNPREYGAEKGVRIDHDEQKQKSSAGSNFYNGDNGSFVIADAL